VDIWSISSLLLWPFVALIDPPMPTFDLFILAGVTENNFESGGTILMDRATLSLFLSFNIYSMV
jgi:hypothetical protein